MAMKSCSLEWADHMSHMPQGVQVGPIWVDLQIVETGHLLQGHVEA